MDTNQTPEENLTAFFLGELEGSDTSIEQMLEDTPEVQDELDSLSVIASLLSESLDNEWRAKDIAFDDQADVTTYALNEFDNDKLAEFEARMHKSSSLKNEVEEIRSFTEPFSRQFENEWMEHYPVDIDQICFTDLVAGELNGFELAQAEALVSGASITQKEADATREMAELLSASLADEWQSQLSPESNFTVVEKDRTEVAEETVVSHDFTKASRPRISKRSPLLMSAAAAITGLIAVGAVFFNSNEAPSNLAQTDLASPVEIASTDSGVWKYNSTTAVADNNEESGLKIPTLMLVDEVADSLESIEVANIEEPSSFSGIQTVGFNKDLDTTPDMGKRDLGGYTFDSLPPIEKGRVTYSVQKENDKHRSILMSDRREHTNGLQSVYVQGLFTFPEGTDFDVDTVFEPKKVEAIHKELLRVRSELENTIVSLDAEQVDISELKRKLSVTLEHYRELDNQLRSK